MKQPRIFKFLVAASIALACVGCQCLADATILEFAAIPAEVEPGKGVYFRWNATGGTCQLWAHTDEGAVYRVAVYGNGTAIDFPMIDTGYVVYCHSSCSGDENSAVTFVTVSGDPEE